METRPVRNNDGGPVINWLADRLMDLSSILLKIAMPYALMYEVVFDDEDKQEQQSCCTVDHSL